MRVDGPISFEIEQSTISNFDGRLMDDVGVGPGFCISTVAMNSLSSLQDSKLKFFDHFGYSINHLCLPPTRQRRFRGLHFHKGHRI
jgi:hypothetical protein